MSYRSDLLQALDAQEPSTALRRTIRELMSGGASVAELNDVLDGVRVELRERGSVRLEDVVLDAQDLLEGWVGPDASDLLLDGRAGVSGEEELFGREGLLEELSRVDAPLLLIV